MVLVPWCCFGWTQLRAAASGEGVHVSVRCFTFRVTFHHLSHCETKENTFMFTEGMNNWELVWYTIWPTFDTGVHSSLLPKLQRAAAPTGSRHQQLCKSKYLSRLANAVVLADRMLTLSRLILMISVTNSTLHRNLRWGILEISLWSMKWCCHAIIASLRIILNNTKHISTIIPSEFMSLHDVHRLKRVTSVVSSAITCAWRGGSTLQVRGVASVHLQSAVSHLHVTDDSRYIINCTCNQVAVWLFEWNSCWNYTYT